MIPSVARATANVRKDSNYLGGKTVQLLLEVKVAAVDPVWSGLKLVTRKERRG